jgi:hypothetical protein
MVTRETTPRRLVARRGALGGEFHPSCRVHCRVLVSRAIG